MLQLKNLFAFNSHFSLLIRATGLALSLLIFAGCATQIGKERRTFETVVVDAGHGGHDSGALGRHVAPEKIWTLAVAEALNQDLTTAGFNVVMTRHSDVFIPLDERVRISNWRPNAVFVSIHFNSAGWKPYVRGLETYYYTGDSIPLAKAVHGKILQIPGVANRGVRKAMYRVIHKNSHAAILVEGGYLTNSWEAARIASPMYRSELAAKICEGIIAYRGRPPEKPRHRTTIQTQPTEQPASVPVPSPSPASSPIPTAPPLPPSNTPMP